jgi:hypothetical protein
MTTSSENGSDEEGMEEIVALVAAKLQKKATGQNKQLEQKTKAALASFSLSFEAIKQKRAERRDALLKAFETECVALASKQKVPRTSFTGI